jgi:capsular polysaccharide biosynthesis protein
VYSLEEEISIRELLEIMFEGKWFILGISFLAVFIAGIFSFYILTEKFEAKANIIFDKKFMEQQGLSIDSYNELVSAHSMVELIYNKLDLESKEVSLKSFKNSIRTEVNKDASLISIIVTSKDPVLAQQAANLLGTSSMNSFSKRLISDKERQIIKYERMLAEVETELEKTPKLLGTFEVQDMGSRVIQVPELNPLYQRLSSRWDQLSAQVTLLKAEKDYLNQGLLADAEDLYIILQKAHLPDEPVSPRKLLNVAVAGILGLMISVFLVFFKKYWNNSNPSN